MTAVPSIGAVAVHDTGILLEPDHSRVITRFLVPGQEDVGPGDSRAAAVIDRIIQLDEGEVVAAMRDIESRFEDRHEMLHDILELHASLVSNRIDPAITLTSDRRLLLGAAFTHEYSIEGAALCNPSAVLCPGQAGDGEGDAAFVLSVRGIGEGHRSSIGFRTGVVTAAGEVMIDEPGPFPCTAPASPTVHSRAVVHAQLAALDDDHENAAYVLDALPAQFGDAELDARIAALVANKATRRHTATTIAHLRRVATSSYRSTFSAASELSERVLWPHSPVERQGMEDARFVRFVEDSGAIAYYATYTAFDGVDVAQHLIATDDFISFTISPMAGAAATGKGLALFPRRIGGLYMALSRSDRETNSIAISDDLSCWPTAHPIQTPLRPWEIVQLGNCGSPIETAAGWLVLTHGVGAMRTYSLGAILLDLDDPRQVIARLDKPIITPGRDTRDGYVPNVVYSCGAFAHGDTLVMPYGMGDQAISIATLSIDQLLGAMHC